MRWLSLVRHAQRDRRIGAVLVRRGGWAVGIFARVRIDRLQGRPPVRPGPDQGRRLVAAALRPAPGPAGAQAYAATADAVARILLPRLTDLEAVVTGGDRAGIDAVLADARLAPIRDKLTGPVLPTPDPRLRVLQAFPDQFPPC